MNRAEYFNKKTANFEASVLADKKNQNIPRQSTFRSPRLKKEKQLFKVTTKIPIVQKNSNATINTSPKRRVRSGRVTDTKTKKNLFATGNVSYSRRTINCIKSNNTARKEILEKVVKALNEGKQFKPPTPEKINYPITPRTPGSAKGYLVLPEFQKLKLRQDAQTPTKDVIKKRRTTRNHFSVVDNNNSTEPKLNNIEVYKQMLSHCRVYSSDVEIIFRKIKLLDDTFESKLKQTPEYMLYEEYFKYETKKEKLYENIKELEEKFKNLIKNKMECGSKVKDFFKKKKEFFDEILKHHTQFENAVKVALDKSRKNGVINEKFKEEELQSISEEESFEY